MDDEAPLANLELAFNLLLELQSQSRISESLDKLIEATFRHSFLSRDDEYLFVKIPPTNSADKFSGHSFSLGLDHSKVFEVGIRPTENTKERTAVLECSPQHCGYRLIRMMEDQAFGQSISGPEDVKDFRHDHSAVSTFVFDSQGQTEGCRINLEEVKNAVIEGVRNSGQLGISPNIVE